MNDISIAQDFNVTGDVEIIQDAAAIILSPDQGPPGARGNGVLSGPNDPLNSVGMDGDFYINTSTDLFFGPKANGAWPAGESLGGPMGPMGPQGPQGAQGAQGPQGSQGVKGDTGLTGPQGVPGVQGPPGTQGPAGPASTVPGPQGPQGVQGPVGPVGPASTVPGPAGPQGAQGPQGVAGPVGPQGPAVTATVIPGDTPPASPADNVLWWETDTGKLMIRYNDGNSAQWIEAAPSIAGPAGAVGAQGPQGVQGPAGPIGVIPGNIWGVKISMAGGTITFTVGAGIACDSTAVSMLKLVAALNKTTAAWALGNNNGALDTGVIAASTFYHVYLIMRTDTGVVDVLISLSATAPTLPSPYTLFRRIGAMVTNASSQWFLVTQYGDEFLYSVAQQDVNVTTALAPAGVVYALSVPPGVSVTALVRFGFFSSNTNSRLLLQCPDELLAVPQAILGNYQAFPPTAGSAAGGASATTVRTNTAQQIRAVASAGSSGLQLATYGWRDTRGKDG